MVVSICTRISRCFSCFQSDHSDEEAEVIIVSEEEPPLSLSDHSPIATLQLRWGPFQNEQDHLTASTNQYPTYGGVDRPYEPSLIVESNNSPKDESSMSTSLSNSYLSEHPDLLRSDASTDLLKKSDPSEKSSLRSSPPHRSPTGHTEEDDIH